MQFIVQQVENGSLSEEEALNQIETEFQQISNVLAASGLDAGRDYLSTAAEPLKQMLETSKKRITGEVSADVYQKKLDSLMAMTKLSVFKGLDENTQRTLALSQLMPNVSSDLIIKLTGASLDLLKKNSAEGGNGNPYDEDTEGVRSYTKVLESNITPEGEPIEGSSEDLDTQIENYLDSIPQYSGAVTSVKQLAPTLDFLSGIKFAKYSEGRGIPQDKVESVRNAMNSLYEGKIRPLVLQEFSRNGLEFLAVEDAPKKETKTRPALSRGPVLRDLLVKEPSVSLVEPVFNGTGISFQPIEGLTGSRKEKAEVRARTLTAKVSPSINKFIRASAHIEGHQDYRKVFEENLNLIFSPETAPLSETQEE